MSIVHQYHHRWPTHHVIAISHASRHKMAYIIPIMLIADSSLYSVITVCWSLMSIAVTICLLISLTYYLIIWFFICIFSSTIGSSFFFIVLTSSLRLIPIAPSFILIVPSSPFNIPIVITSSSDVQVVFVQLFCLVPIAFAFLLTSPFHFPIPISISIPASFYLHWS